MGSALRAVVDGEVEEEDDCVKADADDAIMTVKAAVVNDFMLVDKSCSETVDNEVSVL
jgi:hypothetical protein